MADGDFPRTIHLVISLLAAIAACVVAAFMFSIDFIPSPVFVLGVSWALVVTSLDVGASLALFIRSGLGASLGAAFGLAAAVLSRAMVGDSVNYHLSTGLAFPLAMVLALADEHVKSPLTAVIRSDIGFQALYLVASFSRGFPETAAWQVSATVAIGAGLAFGVSLAFRVLFWHWGSLARLRRALLTFGQDSSRLFEGVTSYLMQGPDHEEEMMRRYRQLDAQLGRVLQTSDVVENNLWWGVSRPLKKELIECVTLVPVQLLSVIRTLHAKYPPSIYDRLWIPLESAFHELASSVAKVLRPGGAASADSQIGNLCDRLYNELIERVHCTRLPDGSGETGTQSPDLLRFVFALIAVMRFSRLAHRMERLRREFLQTKVRWRLWPVFGRATTAVGRIFDMRSWRAVLRSDGRYALKIALCNQILVQPLVAWHEAAPTGIARNAFWAVLPLLYCMLPTVGGALVKGVRRFAGTVVGDGLGLLSVVVTGTGEELGYLAQLFIVTYASRLFVNIRLLGYASFVVGLTWIVTALANWTTQPTLTDKQHTQYAVDRIILTALGSGTCALLGALVLPVYATSLYGEASARVVQSSCDLFERGFVWVLETDRAVLNPETTVSAAELVYSYNVAAGFEATSRLRSEAGSRAGLAEETQGEIWAGKLLLPLAGWRVGRRVTEAEKLMALAPEIDHLQHSATVLFATAAGTLVDEQTQRLAKAELGEAVARLMREIVAQRDTLAECLRLGRATQDAETRLGPLLATTALDEQFARLRDRLVGSSSSRGAEHSAALQGGLLRVYAYLYTVAEFSEAWSHLVNAIVPSHAIFRHITSLDLAAGRRRHSSRTSAADT